jgi:hypothetical protein
MRNRDAARCQKPHGFHAGGERDFPADRFAERSEVTGKLVWDHVEEGLVIRGLVDTQTTQPLIKIVTRASGPDEMARFQHPRMPLLEKPLFASLPLGPEENEDPGLFG